MDKTAPIEIRIIETAPRRDMEALYRDADWWDDAFEQNPDALDLVVRNSALFVGAFSEKKLIGMGRALSDLASDAYIQDVVVLKSHRGKGIGRMIIKKLISGLKEQGVDWIGLVGQPGTRKFYETLGFRELKDHIPFKLEE